MKWVTSHYYLENRYDDENKVQIDHYKSVNFSDLFLGNN